MQSQQTFQFKRSFQKAFDILISRCPTNYSGVKEITGHFELESLNQDQVKSFCYYTKKYLSQLLKNLKSGSKADIEKAKTEIEGNGNDKSLTAIDWKGEEKFFTDTESKELKKANTAIEKSKIETEPNTEKAWDSVTNDMRKNERDLALILLFCLFNLDPEKPESLLKLQSLDLKRIAFRVINGKDLSKTQSLNDIMARFNYGSVTTQLAGLLLDVAGLEARMSDKENIESELYELESSYEELLSAVNATLS
jgi:hypothetical protein